MSDSPEQVLDQDGRSFSYVVTPAADPASPLLVMLHGHGGNTRASRLRVPGAHVLCPLDRFGLKGAGSWFLGEDGDSFWLRAMEELVRRLRPPGQPLYFLGSSMGGYGALLHGMRLGATAIYANIPQTRLLSSTYAAQGMRAYFDNVLGREGQQSPFNDLRPHLAGEDGPFVYLTANRWDRPAYVEEQILALTQAMLDRGTPFRLEILPKHGHSLGRSVAESAAVLMAHQPPGPAGEAEVTAREPVAPPSQAPSVARAHAAPSPLASFLAALPAPALSGSDDTLQPLHDIISRPEAVWTGAHAHMAERQTSIINAFAATNGLPGGEAVFDFIVAAGRHRLAVRPDSYFVVNPGGAGSHWVQEILADTADMNPCGEVYFPGPLLAVVKALPEGDRVLLLDCFTMLHAYRPMAEALERPLINTAHARGIGQYVVTPGPKTCVLLLRDPLDVVLSRTYRKEGFRQKYFGGEDDRTYLDRNVDYVEQFFRKLAPVTPDAVIRYEDLRRDLEGTVAELGRTLGLDLNVGLAEDVHIRRSTNAYAGPEVVIPDDLRDHAAARLAPLRLRYGYGPQ